MDLLTTEQAAELLNTPPATLRYWRHSGVGPKSFKMGRRRVMYKRADVLAWVEAQYADAKGGA